MGIMEYTLGFVILNLIMLSWIAIIQIRNVQKIRSGFTIGLLIFILVFLVQNLIAAYFYATMMPLFVEGLETPVLIMTIFQSIAFGIFLYLTRN